MITLHSIARGSLPRRILLAAAVALVAIPPAAAGSSKRHAAKAAKQESSRPESAKQDATMLHVALPTRIEQRCNARAMGEVGRSGKDMRPDEAVAYAFADPKLGDASIEAPGAAVRSRGHWYHLSYTCRTSADGMEVLAFSFALGGEVPRNDWAAHSLVP